MSDGIHYLNTWRVDSVQPAANDCADVGLTSGQEFKIAKAKGEEGFTFQPAGSWLLRADWQQAKFQMIDGSLEGQFLVDCENNGTGSRLILWTISYAEEGGRKTLSAVGHPLATDGEVEPLEDAGEWSASDTGE